MVYLPSEYFASGGDAIQMAVYWERAGEIHFVDAAKNENLLICGGSPELEFKTLIMP